jgi:prophage DNA circulation protein
MSGALGAILGTGAVSGALARYDQSAFLSGVGFWVLTARDSSARRYARHIFPGRDRAWHEDLGKDPQLFVVEGILYGDDVAEQAERLREAATRPGPALLEHPDHGEVEVAVLGLEITLDENRRRIAEITFKAERWGDRPAPEVADDFLGRLLSTIDTAMAAVRGEVARLRALYRRFDRAVGAVLGLVNSTVALTRSVLSGAGLVGVLRGSATGQALTALAGLAGGSLLPSMSSVASAVTNLPRAIAHEAGGRALLPGTGVPPSAGRPDAAFRALVRLCADSGIALPLPVASPAGVEAAACVAQLRALLMVAAGAEACRAMGEMVFASRQDALAARDRVADALQAAADAAAEAGLPASWRAAVAVRAAAIAEIGERAARLAELERIVLPATTSAAVLAHRLDGDDRAGMLDRASALARRNRVRHPGFVPGGVVLEVTR